LENVRKLVERERESHCPRSRGRQGFFSYKKGNFGNLIKSIVHNLIVIKEVEWIGL
jgi:hypothetical protein